MRIWEILATQPELVGSAISASLAGAYKLVVPRRTFDIVPGLEGLTFVYGLYTPRQEAVLSINQNLETRKSSIKLGITSPEKMTLHDKNADGFIEHVERSSTEPLGCLDEVYHEQLYRFRRVVSSKPPLLELPSRVRYHMLL